MDIRENFTTQNSVLTESILPHKIYPLYSITLTPFRTTRTASTCECIRDRALSPPDQESLLLMVEALKAQLEEQTRLCSDQVGSRSLACGGRGRGLTLSLFGRSTPSWRSGGSRRKRLRPGPRGTREELRLCRSSYAPPSLCSTRALGTFST